ncbi:MAG: DUF3795 domain-containing protein [Eubacteriales bacterium]
MSNIPKFAMCGCRCDLCKAYAPNVEKNDQRETLAKMWNKYYGLDPSVMDSCGGCKDNPSDDNCPVRKCILEKKLNHCGDCGDFLCDVFYQRCGSFPEEKKKEFDMDEYNEYILAYDNETRLKEYKTIKKVSEETMRFIQGKYALDEVGNGKDEVTFCDGDQKILTIYIRDGYYDFQVEENMVRVSDMESLEKAKLMILMRMEPNRKPFAKEQAVYSRCGMRCDLCIHFTGSTISDEFREELKTRFIRVFGGVYDDGKGNGIMLCPGGLEKDCCDCDKRKCSKDKGLEGCPDCEKFPCGVCGLLRSEISTRSMTATDITWAILPYVDDQYGN